jgi:hypothetical protein
MVPDFKWYQKEKGQAQKLEKERDGLNFAPATGCCCQEGTHDVKGYLHGCRPVWYQLSIGHKNRRGCHPWGDRENSVLQIVSHYDNAFTGSLIEFIA